MCYFSVTFRCDRYREWVAMRFWRSHHLWRRTWVSSQPHHAKCYPLSGSNKILWQWKLSCDSKPNKPSWNHFLLRFLPRENRFQAWLESNVCWRWEAKRSRNTYLLWGLNKKRFHHYYTTISTIFSTDSFNCTFDQGLCKGWKNGNFSSDDFDWQFNKMSTPSYSTGPMVDHTLQNDREWALRNK